MLYIDAKSVTLVMPFIPLRLKTILPSFTPLDDNSTKQRLDHAATRFQLPDTSHYNMGKTKVPPIFIVQIQIPSEPPPSMFTTVTDGPGWSILLYFKITEVHVPAL